jgi:hypothetical protein
MPTALILLLLGCNADNVEMTTPAEACAGACMEWVDACNDPATSGIDIAPYCDSGCADLNDRDRDDYATCMDGAKVEAEVDTYGWDTDACRAVRSACGLPGDGDNG